MRVEKKNSEKKAINLLQPYFRGKIGCVSTNKVLIGVLDIQGSVEEHMAVLKKMRISHRAVKNIEDLAEVDGLIIPGGESTTIGKLLKHYELDKEIRKRAGLHGRPLSIWGTCAGAILLAKNVLRPRPDTLGLMDITIERNAYGRQAESFYTDVAIPCLGAKKVRALFIRAPLIKKVGKGVEILAEHGGSPIMVRQKNLLATMFHPELTSDTRVHNYFVSLTKEYAAARK